MKTFRMSQKFVLCPLCPTDMGFEGTFTSMQNKYLMQKKRQRIFNTWNSDRGLSRPKASILPREGRSKNESAAVGAAAGAAAGAGAALVMWRSLILAPLVLGEAVSFHEDGAMTLSRRCSIVWLMEEAEVLPLNGKKRTWVIINPSINLAK